MKKVILNILGLTMILVSVGCDGDAEARKAAVEGDGYNQTANEEGTGSAPTSNTPAAPTGSTSVDSGLQDQSD